MVGRHNFLGSVGGTHVDGLELFGTLAFVATGSGARFNGDASDSGAKFLKRALEQMCGRPTGSVDLEIGGKGGSIAMELVEKETDGAHGLVQRVPFGVTWVSTGGAAWQRPLMTSVTLVPT